MSQEDYRRGLRDGAQDAEKGEDARTGLIGTAAQAAVSSIAGVFVKDYDAGYDAGQQSSSNK